MSTFSSSNKRKGGAQKVRDKKTAQLKYIGNDSKQSKLNFFIKSTALSNVSSKIAINTILTIINFII